MYTNSLLLGDGISITIVRDGQRITKGNFLGLFWIPQQGGREWYAENGDCGICATEAEAISEIKAAWGR